jgi:prepilin-type N-terminal cleavage/methylation domain-containing protein
MGMSGPRGLTLIEVVVVMAIIAISMGLAGPRIVAGLGRLELSSTERTVRALIKMARLEAQRTDRQQYVVLDRDRRSISFVNSDMQLVREEALPASVDVVITGSSTASLFVSPSGIVRGLPIRLQGRAGEVSIE